MAAKTHTPETRAKLTAMRKQMWANPEYREKQRLARSRPEYLEAQRAAKRLAGANSVQ
jgi:hypothetical protein